MKNLPYKNLFVVLQINNSIKKIFFDEVVDYKNYSDVDFDEHKTCMAQVAVVDDKSAEELFVLLCQTYVNTKAVVKEFKSIAKKNCFLSSEMTVTLIFDLHINADDSGTVQIDTWAHDENRDAFNEISKYASDATMAKFVQNLSVEKQDLLFEFV
jgi:hypothetical protein